MPPPASALFSGALTTSEGCFFLAAAPCNVSLSGFVSHVLLWPQHGTWPSAQEGNGRCSTAGALLASHLAFHPRGALCGYPCPQMQQVLPLTWEPTSTAPESSSHASHPPLYFWWQSALLPEPESCGPLLSCSQLGTSAQHVWAGWGSTVKWGWACLRLAKLWYLAPGSHSGSHLPMPSRSGHDAPEASVQGLPLCKGQLGVKVGALRPGGRNRFQPQLHSHFWH